MVVASVIVLPVFSCRPPRMNIEQMERSTPARTPMAITTSIRLKPCSPPCRTVMFLCVLMTVSSSLERAVGARDRPGRRHGDRVTVVARVVDRAADGHGLGAGARRSVGIEGDRRGAGGFEVRAVQSESYGNSPVVGVGGLVRRREYW